jgi:hypothetical protein
MGVIGRGFTRQTLLFLGYRYHVTYIHGALSAASDRRCLDSVNTHRAQDSLSTVLEYIVHLHTHSSPSILLH